MIRIILALFFLTFSFGHVSAVGDSEQAPPTTVTENVDPTLRIPQNIRVLLTDGSIVVVPIETYVARALAQEWFSSWGNYEGGMNALKAGAVAIRSYAISFINAAGPESSYDICATASCQVYRENSTPNAEKAALETAGYVLCTSSHVIARSEYSAENNSLGFGCGDGFTQPSGGCIPDDVCAGEKRSGHGKGMCQWGTAKWATGLKLAGNGGTNYPANANSGIMHGFPRKDWLQLLQHYYPTLVLIKATPLQVGDPVKLFGLSERTNYTCLEESLATAARCDEFFIKEVGATGKLVKGPLQVGSDGKHFTWWKVEWADQTTGWIQENWLERAVPGPDAPSALTANLISGKEVALSWQPPAARSILGFKVERSVNASSNWVEIKELPASVRHFSDRTILPASINHYRVRAFSAIADSAYTAIKEVFVPDAPPVLAPIPAQIVERGTTLCVTNAAVAPDLIFPITDFEHFSSGELAMFRAPAVSLTTTPFLESNPNVAAVTARFPAGEGMGARVMNIQWSFKSGIKNPWVRLTTGGRGKLSNPVIDLKKTFQFDIHSDKPLKIALGCRETSTPAGTAIGSDGGQVGPIEFVGAASKAAKERPQAVHAVKSNAWTTVSFHLPSEPVVGLTGNGALSTRSGLGVMEHLAFVPGEERGAFNVFLDNFRVVQTKKLTFSLDAESPDGAAIDPNTGVFSWAPSEAHADADYRFTVRVADDADPSQSDTITFVVTVVGKQQDRNEESLP